MGEKVEKKFAEKFPFLWTLEHFIHLANMLRGQNQPIAVSQPPVTQIQNYLRLFMYPMGLLIDTSFIPKQNFHGSKFRGSLR